MREIFGSPFSLSSGSQGLMGANNPHFYYPVRLGIACASSFGVLIESGRWAARVAAVEGAVQTFAQIDVVHY
jgi:hypothetical protein